VKKRESGKAAVSGKQSLLVCLLLVLCYLLAVSSCGYRLIGSTPLPFRSVTIKQVLNKTYEPRLEEKMHNALSKEFINQGIEVMNSGGEVELETTVLNFQIGAIASVNEMIKEQSIILQVDIRLTDHSKVIEFKSLESPIKITFQSTGTVTESAAFKERATDKACSEIAKEMVSRIILRYAK